MRRDGKSCSVDWVDELNCMVGCIDDNPPTSSELAGYGELKRFGMGVESDVKVAVRYIRV
jgi:hypothetical protein